MFLRYQLIKDSSSSYSKDAYLLKDTVKKYYVDIDDYLKDGIWKLRSERTWCLSTLEGIKKACEKKGIDYLKVGE